MNSPTTLTRGAAERGPPGLCRGARGGPGARPRRLLAAHPDLRPDLEAFLAGHDEVVRLRAPPRRWAGRRSRPIAATRDEPDAPPGPRRARRLPPAARGGPGRHGRGLRGRADLAARRVALKVLPFAAAIDPRQLQRFKTEALAAAHLHHENIVPVHAVGCERGVHYYAMQFIEGQSLAALIGELRALRDERPTERASPRAADRRPESPPGGGAASAATTISRECSSTAAGIRPGGRAGPAGGPGAGARPPGGDRPPRRQAGQPAAGPPRAALGHRLRPGPGHGRCRADDDGRDARHAALRQPRAGPGAAGDRRPPQRRLLARRHAL